MTVLALLREILPLGSGRLGWFNLSISISKISFKAFQEHIKAQTDNPCRIEIDAKSPLGICPKASKEPKITPMRPVKELPNRNNVNHELTVDCSLMIVLPSHLT